MSKASSIVIQDHELNTGAIQPDNNSTTETSTHQDNPINNENQCYNDEQFWQRLISFDPCKFSKMIVYLLEEYGTAEACNRFDVGNTIEFIIGDFLKDCGFKVLELPNAKRFDIEIVNYKKLSIKYSSTGNIKLHNSNGCMNKDISMQDTILLTPTKLYLISNALLCKNNIDINDYIKNTNDGLELKRKLLTKLEKENYLYMYDINISYNKTQCKNRLCSKTFFSRFKEEYELSLKQ